MNFSIFEIGMLACFGVSWPVSISKSVKSKSTKGKSLLFLVVILSGYVFGIVHKIMYSRDIVLILYILNFFMISIDIMVFLKNKKREEICACEQSD